MAGPVARSIQLRIVAGTLLMSAVVVLLIGWVMMNQVTEGVLDSRRQGARTEAAAQIRDTQAQLDAADSTAQDTGVLLNQLVSENVTRGADSLYDVVLLIPGRRPGPDHHLGPGHPGRAAGVDPDRDAEQRRGRQRQQALGHLHRSPVRRQPGRRSRPWWSAHRCG